MNQLLTKQAQTILQPLQQPRTIKADATTDIAFLNGIRAYKQLRELLDSVDDAIKQAMLDNNVKKLDLGKQGSIQFVPRPYYQIDGHVAPRFLRQAVDGEEVKLYMRKHSGKAPKGVIVKSSNVFRKSLK